MSTPENTPVPSPEPEAAPRMARPVRIGRFQIGLNVLVQLLLVFGIVLLGNYLSTRHFKRWDFSRNQKYALSPRTKNLLGHLDAPVHAIVFFPPNNPLTGDVGNLMREYEYASNRKFVVEQVDPFRNLTRARELAEKYKFGASDNIVILDYKGKSKFVDAQAMADIDQGNPMLGQAPSLRAFKGEEAITSALMEITEPKQNKLYYTTGHGETELGGEPLQVLREELVRQNVANASLNLSNVDALPADLTALLIVGPKTDFTERDLKLVGDFWNDKKGRLFVMLTPAAKTPRLDAWLSSQGVTPQMDRVLKTATGIAMDENGQPVFRSGVVTSPAAILVPGGKGVTKDVAGNNLQLLGATESLVLDRTKAQTDKIRLTSLIEAGEGYWGSTTFSTGDTRKVFFDPKKDHQGPLTLAAAVEKGGLEDPRVKVETARMIVIGNAGLLTMEGVQMSQIGVDFALNSMNWMFNREEVAGIAPKRKEPTRLEVSDEKLFQLQMWLLGIAGLVAVTGTAVWWQRRS